jgi:hypothetical protein
VLVRFRPGAPTRLFRPVLKRPQPSAQCSKALEKQALPELLRVKAEILISAKNPDLVQAEHLLREALDLASLQSCLGWELRIATSLAKLWVLQGRHDEARAVRAGFWTI